MERSMIMLLFCLVISEVTFSFGYFAATNKLRTSTLNASPTSTIQEYGDNVMTTYARYPLTVSHGKGCKLYDDNGKEYLDCTAGIATCCLGHSNDQLKAAICNQMDKVHHVSNLYFIPEQALLAKWLVSQSCADKVFFCNSGAEANEAAIKLTRKYAHTVLNIEHPVILTAVNSFHGRTLTTITATGQPKYQKNFGPLTPGFEYFEYNNIDSVKALISNVNSQGGGKKVAGILIESLQGEGGIKPGDVSFFQSLRQLCDDNNILLICDEVQTGVGRTGKMWGYENLQITPDIFTVAKAIGGGVPLGAMLCKDKVNVFSPGDHASTFGGNPLACAAGLAVANAFTTQNLLANVVSRGDQFRSLAKDIQSKNPNLIKDVRGWGLINGIELAGDCGITAADMTKTLMEAGVLVVPAGPSVVRFVPPLIITEREVAFAMDKFRVALELLSNKLAKASS